MEQKIKFLVELNRKHSEQFCSHRLERDLYRANHPTHVVAFKCMDGRIHLPNITNTPLGIIKPYRNIGGKFNLGWPLLNSSFNDVVMEAVSHGNRVLILATYHFSEGDEHRGCAGFKYDCKAAVKATAEFRDQIKRVYGKDSQIVVPILIGVETDKDAIILHGDKNEQIDLSKIKDASEGNVLELIRGLYPNMPERIVLDLLPLVQGNIAHIEEVRGKKPETDLVHGEWVLAVGKGFDWLHTPNLALIVGPYDPNISEPITTATSIIKSNFEGGRINRGFVVLASAAFADAGDRMRAKERSYYMQDLTREIVSKHFPDMLSHMHPLSVVINYNTMEMEII